MGIKKRLMELGDLPYSGMQITIRDGGSVSGALFSCCIVVLSDSGEELSCCDDVCPAQPVRRTAAASAVSSFFI